MKLNNRDMWLIAKSLAREIDHITESIKWCKYNFKGETERLEKLISTESELRDLLNRAMLDLESLEVKRYRYTAMFEIPTDN